MPPTNLLLRDVELRAPATPLHCCPALRAMTVIPSAGTVNLQSKPITCIAPQIATRMPAKDSQTVPLRTNQRGKSEEVDQPEVFD